jgi:AcrR family transcriptional regulator
VRRFCAPCWRRAARSAIVALAVAKARGYNSPIRRQQADDNRRRILDAARELLRAHGFDATTVDAIAEAAGVAPPTVYAAFGSKRGIVHELLERARFGTAYEELVARAMATDDPRERLGYAARISRQIYDAERDEIALFQGAGTVHPQLGEPERNIEGRRYDAQGPMIDYLVATGSLRAGISAESARDVLWTLTGREVYRMLVVERGWSSTHYQRWLSALLQEQLIG